MLYGLIGYPLSHSLSAAYFNEKFFREGITNARYELFELPSINDFPKLLASNPALCGLNVTIPYKQSIIPFLTSIDKEVAAVGAVNCIKIKKGLLHGYNTDIVGFRQSLEPMLPAQLPKAIILGSGGSARAVAYVLGQLGIEYKIVSRAPANQTEIGYEQLNENLLASHRLMINTTPLGMFPDLDAAPALPFQAITPHHICYDLVYNPTKTLFLINCEKKGATIKNGMDMLYLQAEASWRIWGGE